MRRLPDLRPVAVAAGLALAVDLLGLGTRDAIFVGMVALVVGYLALLAMHGDRVAWPGADLEATDGTRREMNRLTWSLIGRDGRVSEAAVRQLRADAARRLAGYGVTLGDPRAVALLGPKVHATLTTHGGLMPSLREIAACVEAVEALGPARPPAPPTPAPPTPAPPAPSPATTRPDVERPLP